MPLEQKDMDKLLPSQDIDSKYTDFLTKMKRGKYYSQAEITALILGKSLLVNESLINLKSESPKARLTRLTDIIDDISFVNCAVQINRALCKLKVAEKNNDLYYALI